MKPMIRIAVVAVCVALAGLACGSSGAGAAENQSAASEFLKGLSKMAAKQTFNIASMLIIQAGGRYEWSSTTGGVVAGRAAALSRR